jgi:hypothetical protein
VQLASQQAPVDQVPVVDGIAATTRLPSQRHVMSILAIAALDGTAGQICTSLYP